MIIYVCGGSGGAGGCFEGSRQTEEKGACQFTHMVSYNHQMCRLAYRRLRSSVQFSSIQRQPSAQALWQARSCACNAPYRQGKATKKKKTQQLSYSVMHKSAVGHKQVMQNGLNTFLVALYARPQSRQVEKERAQQVTAAKRKAFLRRRRFAQVSGVFLCAASGRGCIITIRLCLKLETRRTARDFAQRSPSWRDRARQHRPKRTAQTQAGHFRGRKGNPGSLGPVL